jgi:mannan endo-1,4-beta-mannosidase
MVTVQSSSLLRPALNGFVERRGPRLWLNGSPFRIAGANIYSFAFRTEEEQIRLLDLAQRFHCKVLRVWAFLEGDPAGDTEVCFHCLRPGAPAEIREGEYGLDRLDRAVKLAGERGIRLILPLTNYHADYGGMPQYQRWLGLQDRHDFYRDASAQAAFRNWVAAIVTRYANEPAVLAWEIANEPRCPGDPALLTGWLTGMSRFLREKAPRQLIAAGDEGFFDRRQAGSNWLFNGASGVSAEDILGIPDIDLGTYHLYPDQWAPDEDPVAFGQMWIAEHLAAGDRAGKPVVLEEYGLPASIHRDAAYGAWLEAIEQKDGAGSLVWMIGEAGQGDRYLLTDPEEAPAVAAYGKRSCKTGSCPPT